MPWFNAPSLQSINEFYQTALENGAKCNGKPGFRPEYEEGYYTAFIIGSGGHNVEAVYNNQFIIKVLLHPYLYVSRCCVSRPYGW